MNAVKDLRPAQISSAASWLFNPHLSLHLFSVLLSYSHC
jgi:hypothetical protein